MSDQDDLLDIKHAAELLGVSETSLRRWTNSGQLACLRVGRRRERRFRRSDLLAFLVEQPATVGVHTGRGPAQSAGHVVADGPEIALGSHLCGFYATDAGRVSLATKFLAEGLHAGSMCYLVATPLSGRAVVAQLGRDHPSLQADIAAGRLVLSKYAPTAELQLEYYRTEFSAALDAGAPSLRLVGDVCDLAGHLTASEVVDYEAAYDRSIARSFPVVTLCQYDLREIASGDVLGVLQNHGDTFRYPSLAFA